MNHEIIAQCEADILECEQEMNELINKINPTQDDMKMIDYLSDQIDDLQQIIVDHEAQYDTINSLDA